jgi:fluoride ion exporter CrcB/FEX
MEIIILTLFGMFGGIVRAIVGLLKHKVFSGKEKFKSGKFWLTIIISGLIGIFCALLLIDDFRVALLAGYAGTDLIQGIYKTVKK